jgi:hypothetical protein
MKSNRSLDATLSIYTYRIGHESAFLVCAKVALFPRQVSLYVSSQLPSTAPLQIARLYKSSVEWTAEPDCAASGIVCIARYRALVLLKRALSWQYRNTVKGSRGASWGLVHWKTGSGRPIPSFVFSIETRYIDAQSRFATLGLHCALRGAGAMNVMIQEATTR